MTSRDRQFRRTGLAAILATVLLAGFACAASADDERTLLALLNSSRQAHRLPALQRNVDLDEYARRHCRRLAARGSLFHSTRDQLRGLVGTPAGRVAENVAVGQDVTGIHQGLMRSRKHRANILGSFDAVGLAIDRGEDGRLYVTEVFLSAGR